MKLKGGWLTGNAPPNARGRVVIRNTQWGVVAQAWPRKRSKRWSPSAYWWYTQFKIAAYMSSTAIDLDLATATEMAKGTQQVPRDILMMCAYGTYYTVTMPDGTVLQKSTKTAPENFQTTGTVEMIDAAMWTDWASTTFGTGAFAFKGVTLTPSSDIDVGMIVIRWNVNIAFAYRLVIAEINSTGQITAITASIAFAPAIGGSQNVSFLTDVTLQTGIRYAIMIGRTDGTGTYAFPIVSCPTPDWHGPIQGGPEARFAGVNPVVGSTLDLSLTLGLPIALYTTQEG